jgi:arylsulfatase A-like enzyme
VLEGAMQHTDNSIGQIIAALKAAGIWDSTLLVLTAKHGQAPRVGVGGLMQGGTLPSLLGNAGIPVAQATEDDVSLLWLQNQSQTQAAVAALQSFKATGTINVTFQGVTQTLPASQIINQIIADTPNADASLESYNLGNPATDSTTPDIVVTLQPGYIWVGNVFSKFKNAEHGGFSQDDTHIALILSGGAIGSNLQGTTQTVPVQTVQIAVTALDALGLNPFKLTGARADHTKALPGTGIPAFRANLTPPEKLSYLTTDVDRSFGGLVGIVDAERLARMVGNLIATIHWGDGHISKGAITRTGDEFLIRGQHEYTAPGMEKIIVTLKDQQGHTFVVNRQAHVVDQQDSMLATDSVLGGGL